MKKTLTTLTLTVLFVWSAASQATAYDEANWYVSIDVQQVREKIVPLLPKEATDKNDFPSNITSLRKCSRSPSMVTVKPRMTCQWPSMVTSPVFH